MYSAIERCSFLQNRSKEALEEYVVQDADLLESVGAVAIARTFTSGGLMGNAFYCLTDPRAERRGLDDSQFILDLIQSRLLRVSERLYTETARKLGRRCHRFTEEFLEEFLAEIK